MALKSRKVAIVGTGLVGSSTAFSLITQGVCEEILMIDLNEERALGEAIATACEYDNGILATYFIQTDDLSY